MLFSLNLGQVAFDDSSRVAVLIIMLCSFGDWGEVYSGEIHTFCLHMILGDTPAEYADNILEENVLRLN